MQSLLISGFISVVLLAYSWPKAIIIQPQNRKPKNATSKMLPPRLSEKGQGNLEGCKGHAKAPHKMVDFLMYN
jgi:hypothetical protein